jgi:hypothetical protein
LTDFQTCFAPVAFTLEGAEATGVLWQAARGRFLLDVKDDVCYLMNAIVLALQLFAKAT